MDAIISNDSSSFFQMALYAVISFFAVGTVAILFYVACSKKYKLNWFERNLLESAEIQELAQSQEALVGGSGYISVKVGHEWPPQGKGGSAPLKTPPTKDTFWVPDKMIKEKSLSKETASSGEESLPASPTSNSSGESTETTRRDPNQPLPLARDGKHVVLSSTSPVRPRVASMQAKLDHTKIDSSLYQKISPARTPSIPEDMRGSLHLTLSYDPVAGLLTVRLVEAHDLEARDFSGTADPYAKIRLLPDRNNVWQTRIHKRTLNPVFDEDFVFEVRPATIGRRTLEILLYDFDAFSRHLCIGGIQLALAHIDLSEKVVLWKGLGPCSDKDSKADLGDLMVSMAYLPSAERLTILVVKARNLRVVDDSRTSSDPYVKVSLIQGNKRLKKRKTGVHRNTVCPVFNEELTFDVSKDVLKNCFVEFCIFHDSLLGASDLLGRAILGNSADCRPEERDFFNEMFRSKTATAQWLTLIDGRV